MRRHYKIAIAAAICVAGLVCFWYDNKPLTGSRPRFPDTTPVSIDISVFGSPLTTITNVAGLTSVMGMLRSGRSVETHECKHRGRMALRFANQESLRVGFLPGHHFLRYEFDAPGGLFAVPRSQFLGALKAAGVDVHKIPTK
jgi:hypothetical protein